MGVSGVEAPHAAILWCSPPSWRSSVREDLRGGFQQALGELEQEVAGLCRELAGLKADQEAMGKHVEGLLEQLKALRADVSPKTHSPPSTFFVSAPCEGL